MISMNYMIEKRAAEIVKLIYDEYISNKNIFISSQNLLENQRPNNVEYCSLEHARFYFYLIFNDHGTKSRNLYEKFKELYFNNKELFSPMAIVSKYGHNDELLKTQYLSNLGLRYPTQSAKSWIFNSEILIDKYEGEPINLFKSTNNAISLFKQIKEFRSYGAKTSGLLLRVIRGVGFNRKLENIADVPLPIDIHDSRIAFTCGIYNPEGADNIQKIYNSPKHIKKIEKIWRNAAKSAGVEWAEIDRALWLLGSIGCTKKLCNECPIKLYCEVGSVHD